MADTFQIGVTKYYKLALDHYGILECTLIHHSYIQLRHWGLTQESIEDQLEEAACEDGSMTRTVPAIVKHLTNSLCTVYS